MNIQKNWYTSITVVIVSLVVGIMNITTLKAEPSQEWTFHKTDDGQHPDGTEQALLWLMNQARQNPVAEGIWLATTEEPDVAIGRDFFNVDTTLLQDEFADYESKPPAAFDVRLYEAAFNHSQDLVERDANDHEGQFERVEQAGFKYSAIRGNVNAFAESALNTHASWNIDWGLEAGGMQADRGHRSAIMSLDNDYTNVGIAAIAETQDNTEVGPLVVTGNYAKVLPFQTDHFDRFIVGTVWQDVNDNERYDPEEGISNITVTPNQGDYFAVTSQSGGYAIPITEVGDYEVTFSGEALDNPVTKSVSIAETSVLLDLVMGEVGQDPNNEPTTNNGKEQNLPVVNLTPSSLDFGNNTLNITSDATTVTVANTGQAELQDINIAITGEHSDEFGTPSSTCQSTLSAEQNCEIQVTFTPTQTGVREALLSITSNASSSPDQITVTGTGVAVDEPVVKLTPLAVDFGEQILETSSAETTITLQNKGQAELTEIEMTLENDQQDEFATPSSTCGETLATEETCTVTITFTPKLLGTRQASLSVTSNASTSPDKVMLQGFGQIGDSLGNAFAFDAEGNIVETTVKFNGGVAIATENDQGELVGTEFISSREITLEQPIVVSGVMTSLPKDHIGQPADTIVVGFYVRERDFEGNPLLKNDKASSDNCDPTLVKTVNEGGYYMVQRRPDIYCDWIVEGGAEGWCIDSVSGARSRKKLETPQEYFELWNGHLADLKALERVTLSDPLLFKDIYKGKIDGSGHVCVYFGYRLLDNTLVFNGQETMNIRIKE